MLFNHKKGPGMEGFPQQEAGGRLPNDGGQMSPGKKAET